MLDKTSSNLATNIKDLRESRHFTQQELAKVSGVPRPTIANLESGGANPTLSVLVKVASALRVSIEELIGKPRVTAIHHPCSRQPTRQRGGVTVRKLLPSSVIGLEIHRLELGVSSRLSGTPHTPGTREYFVCESGELELWTADQSFKLTAGDVVMFRGDQRHSYSNRGRKSAVAYSVVALAPLGT